MTGPGSKEEGPERSVRAITERDAVWDDLILYASGCSWKAGPRLARMMKEGLLHDWERVFVALENNRIAGYCTLSKEDGLPAVGYSPFIGFVFVGEEWRGKRLSQRLVDQASDYAGLLGFERVYIASGEKGLYEKYGFSLISGQVERSGKPEQIFCRSI